MGLHQNKNGLFNMCENGYVQLSDCPGFDCRPIIYVDKKATGTGDGSSWANAYTDIQTAINAHPCKEIQIQGYGENDCYPGKINLLNCVYLRGVNDIWINGENTNIIGINGNCFNYTKIENINIKGCKNSCFAFCQELIDCDIKDTILNGNGNQSGGFYECQILNNCIADNIRCNNSFTNCKTMIDCASKNSFFGFWIAVGLTFDLTNCVSLNHSFASFGGRPGSMFINCIADGTQDQPGFGSAGCTYISCISRNNQNCGYKNFTSPNTYLNCQDINNCLSENSLCTLGDPSFNCDTV